MFALGTGFATYSLPHPLHTMALGICMDLNAQPPADWTIEDGPYELADHCIETKANILLILNAWLDSDREINDTKDWATMNYWVARLRPLWARSEELEEEDDESDRDGSEDEETLPEGHETIVVVCNRSGHENGMSGTLGQCRLIFKNCDRFDIRGHICHIFSQTRAWSAKASALHGQTDRRRRNMDSVALLVVASRNPRGAVSDNAGS